MRSRDTVNLNLVARRFAGKFKWRTGVIFVLGRRAG